MIGVRRPWLWTGVAAVLLVLVFSLAGCCGGCGTPPRAATPLPVPQIPDFPVPEPVREPENVATDILVQNVLLQLEEGVWAHVRYLRGELHSRAESGVVVLGDQNGYVIRIFYAEIAIPPTVLATLLERYAFGRYSDLIQIRDVDIRDNRVRIEAAISKAGVALPLTLVANLSTTPDGWLVADPTRILFCEVPVTSLLKAFDTSLDEIADLKKLEGVRIEGNKLLLLPAKLLPPPPIEGYLASVAVQDSVVVLRYRPGGSIDEERIAELVPPDTTAPNFIYLRHGSVRIRKLYMVEAEAMFIDQDPSDPFYFYLDHYYKQLVAGYGRVLAGLGLQYYVPDFDQIGTMVGPEEEQIDPSRRPPR